MPLRGSIVDETLALVRRLRTEPMHPATRLGHHGVYPEFPDDLTDAGFRGLELFGFDLEQTYGHAGWLGRMRASAAVSTMPADAQRAFADELGRVLARYPDPLPVPHRVAAIVGRAPSRGA